MRSEKSESDLSDFNDVGDSWNFEEKIDPPIPESDIWDWQTEDYEIEDANHQEQGK